MPLYIHFWAQSGHGALVNEPSFTLYTSLSLIHCRLAVSANKCWSNRKYQRVF